MGLFRCKHEVPMSKMENLELNLGSGGPYNLFCTPTIHYKGFCRDCKAYVSLTEEINSRALLEYLDRQNRVKKELAEITNTAKQVEKKSK